MRWLGVILAAVLGVAAAVVGWEQSRRGHPPHPSVVKAAFEADHPPHATVDVRDFPQALWPDELIHPGSALPRSYLHDPGELRRLRALEDHCVDGETGALSKAWEVARARCGSRALPESFFAQPPFMHPSGVSYAQLGNGPPAFRHHRELDRNGPLAFFARITSWEALALARGDGVVITTDDVMLRMPAAERDELPRYHRHARALFLAFIRERGLTMEPLVNVDRCVLVDGNACWRADSEGNAARARTLQALTVAAVASLLVNVLVLWVQQLRAARRLRATRAMVLKTLTHELRTPATGLTLSLETVRADFDRLGEPGQDAFLRMCDDVNRIRRVLHASTRYLSAGGGLGVERARVPSVKGLLEELLAPYAAVHLVVEPDGAFTTDAWWLGICVTNLVENAQLHGRPPIRVRVHVTKELTVSVEDAGAGPTLRSGAFARSPASTGMGLGLELVETIAQALDGKLVFTRHPTRFSVVLRGRT